MRHQLVDDVRTAAIEVMPVTALDRQRAHSVQEVGAADAAGLREARTPAPPDERHSVLSRERAAIEGTANLTVSLRCDDPVNRNTANVFPPPLFAPLVEHRYGTREIDGRYTNTENVHS